LADNSISELIVYADYCIISSQSFKTQWLKKLSKSGPFHSDFNHLKAQWKQFKSVAVGHKI